MPVPRIHKKTRHFLAQNVTHTCCFFLQGCLSLSPSTPLLHDEHLYSAIQPCSVAGQCGAYRPNLLSAVLCLQVGILWNTGWTTNHELEWCCSALSGNCLPARWMSVFILHLQIPCCNIFNSCFSSSFRINAWSTRYLRAHHFHHVIYCCYIPVYILLCLHCCFAPLHYRFHSEPRGPVPQRHGPGGFWCFPQSPLLLGNANEASSVT